VLSLLLSLKMWVPMCKVLFCCFAWLVEISKQKRYRYTGKERDDSSGLSYYGARYLAPWLTRWISPDSAGAVDGLNLYVYVAL
jgi:RHS repeat-associated protein